MTWHGWLPESAKLERVLRPATMSQEQESRNVVVETVRDGEPEEPGRARQLAKEVYV